MKIRADILMVEQGLAESRARAQTEIEAGNVFAGKELVRKPSQKLDADRSLSLKARSQPWVSRAALKLLHGLEQFETDLEGKTVLDLGASTGGFTEVALTKGASHVFALDVGHGQLHASLKGHPRITLLENTNARHIDSEDFDRPIEAIVCDLSFISLKLALPNALALAQYGAQLIALIKPQFEVGKSGLGSGGIVRDADAQARVCEDISGWLEKQPGWRVTDLTESPIEGGDGNREYLIAAEKTAT